MLEEKIDKLTSVMERVAIALEGGASVGGTAGATTAKPKAEAKPKAAAKPKTTADQLKAKFAELKAREDIGTPPLKTLISDQGCENLAELLVSPDKFDAAMTAMTELETAADAKAAESSDEDEL